MVQVCFKEEKEGELPNWSGSGDVDFWRQVVQFSDNILKDIQSRNWYRYGLVAALQVLKLLPLKRIPFWKLAHVHSSRITHLFWVINILLSPTPK